jgi:gingipain R
MKHLCKLVVCGIVFATKVNAQIHTSILSNTNSKTVVEISFENINISSNETYKQLQFPNSVPLQAIGAPAVAQYAFALQIPGQKASQLKVLSSTSTIVNNVIILPSKGKLSRDVNPTTVPYTYGNEYTSNQFYPSQIATANTPYILRDLRGQSIQVCPVQYNPVSKQANVISKMVVELTYTNDASNNTLATTELPSILPDVFADIYYHKFINYAGNEHANKKTRYNPVIETGKLLVITPQKYLNTIQPYIDWKKQKGIYTTVVVADTISGGINEATLKNLAKNHYLDFGISYLLLVGDNTDLPAMNEAGTIPTLFGASDNAYGYMTGSDHYMEVLVGRFSAENIYDLEGIVTKSIAYEKAPNLVTNWYRNTLGIASDQGTGDDNEYDYQHIRNILDSSLLSNTYANKFEFFDGNQGGEDDVNSPYHVNIIDSINGQGTSLINYAGHGTVYGINTSQFTVAEASTALTNTAGNWPCMLTVGCSAGVFMNLTCFAEAMARARDTATQKPVGTVINAMATVQQWWFEPMEAQDEFNAILNNGRGPYRTRTFAGMLASGCFSMNDKYNVPNDPNAGNEMTDTWINFGDPTLVMRTNNLGSIPLGCLNIPMHSTSYSIACGVDSADVCLYYKGEILAVAKSNNGVANFNFPQGVHDSLATVIVTATKFNYAPSIVNTIVANYRTNINTISKNDFKVYPNPSKTNLFISYTQPISYVQIISAEGKLINTININKNEAVINTENLATGNYFLKIITNNGVGNQMFSKQ